MILKSLKNAGKRKLLETLLANQVALEKRFHELGQQINSLRGDIRGEVEKQFGEKIEMIDASLKDSILIKEVFYEKGFLTRQEVTAKYGEMKRGG